MDKFQSYGTNQFMQTLIHIFLPSISEIGKTEMTKLVCGIRHEKS